MLNPVINADQVKEITGGRVPLVPEEYETAINALVSCTTFDETKYWSAKADALAAWAKIYHSDEAGRRAKLLKLHAYRRMGQLAQELRKARPVTLLREHGLSQSEAGAARKLSKLSKRQFADVLKRPRSPLTVAYDLLAVEPTWRDFGRCAQSLAAYCRTHDPVAVARGLKIKRYDVARDIVVELVEWLDEFEQCLPHAKET